MSYIPSVIPPGNHEAKVLNIELKTRPYKTKTQATIFDIVLNLETKPMGGTFRGLKKDFSNPNSETYLGQVGRVKTSEWGYSDGTTGGGIEIFADKEILKGLKSLCMEIGQLKFFQDLDDKFLSPEAMVKEINDSGIFKDHYLYWCIASKQYIKKNNYPADDLYLPRYSAEAGKPFSKKMDGLITYDMNVHLTKPKTAAVKNSDKKKEDKPAQTEMDLKESENLGKDPTFTGNDDNDDLPF